MRIVLCDENLLLGEALAPALAACGHEIAAITTTLGDALAAVRAHQPGACLLDPRFRDGAGALAAVRLIRMRHPGTAVVILASKPDAALVSEARELGAAGYLSKDSNVAQIAQALDVVAAGRAVFETAAFGRPRARAQRRGQPHYE